MAGLLKKLQGPSLPGEVMRDLRGIDLLEHIGSPEAGVLLKKLAHGEPEALQTREAQAALARLKGKKP